jgi:hypothetical protein
MSEVPLETEIPPEEVMEEVLQELADLSSSSTMLYIGLAVLLAVVGGAAYYLLVVAKAEPKKKEVDADEGISSNTVGLKDISYLASKLSPESKHLDILYAVASTPENIAYGLRAYHAKEKSRAERIAEDLEEAKNGGKKTTIKKPDALFDVDDDGWADDDDEDDKAKLAAQTEKQEKKDREDLQKAVGKTKVLLEGLDDGVIGQKWVETTLSSNGVWPPKNLSMLEGVKFDYDGKQVSALDHPGLRRNLCMITGRLNSMLLNSHPELCKYRRNMYIHM